MTMRLTADRMGLLKGRKREWKDDGMIVYAMK